MGIFQEDFMKKIVALFGALESFSSATIFAAPASVPARSRYLIPKLNPLGEVLFLFIFGAILDGSASIS
jgi:hypothetical protein